MARIVFMGTPAFAVASLEACLTLGEVVAVVTQPDKPRGRGQEVSFSPVKQKALERGLPVLQPLKLRTSDFHLELRTFAADVAVVTAYGKILPKAVLDVPRLGCVNVHASLLPRWRGAAPIQWAVASGDAQTGVCLMQMDEGMDTGPVLARATLPIGPTDTSATLHDALAQLGGLLLRDHLPSVLAGTSNATPQASEGVTPAPMISKEEGQLDFRRPALQLERRLRAFTPWPGAYTTFEGRLLKVHAVRVAEGSGPPGCVLRAQPQGLELACGEGALQLLTVQPEGKKPMPVKDFLLGHPIAVGSFPFGNVEPK